MHCKEVIIAGLGVGKNGLRVQESSPREPMVDKSKDLQLIDCIISFVISKGKRLSIGQVTSTEIKFLNVAEIEPIHDLLITGQELAEIRSTVEQLLRRANI